MMSITAIHLRTLWFCCALLIVASVHAWAAESVDVKAVNMERETIEPSGSTENQEKKKSARVLNDDESRRQNNALDEKMGYLLREREDMRREIKEIEMQYAATPDPESFRKLHTIDCPGIGIQNFFRALDEVTGLHTIVNPELKIVFPVNLYKVRIGDIIDVCLKTYDLDRFLIGKVMRIGTKREIQDMKDERSAAYKAALEKTRKRLEKNKVEIEEIEKKREKAFES